MSVINKIDIGKGGEQSYCSPHRATRERGATYRKTKKTTTLPDWNRKIRKCSLRSKVCFNCSMQHIPRLELAEDAKEELVYCKNQIITSNEVALLIIKPSNSVANANGTDSNIRSIINRFEEKEWTLQALKLLSGAESNLDRLIAHYPQPFFDGQAEDVSPRLTTAEKDKLKDIWGEEATSYPMYHPVQIVKRDMASYQIIAKVWHTGRGTDNQLLNTGDSRGINNVSPQKDPIYGRRLLLLVKDNPALPGIAPFFIVNGFSAELVVKFSRSGEKIAIMAFGRELSSSYDLGHMREYVVGTTDPRYARPGSIRYDALHSEEYTGSHPITSADTVGIGNNIVHLSENSADAYHELRLWLPEVLWYPPTGPYAPDISFKSWDHLRKLYIERQLQSYPSQVNTPDPGALQKLSLLAEPSKLPAMSINMMAGGSGGRFFGYELPEHLRNKFFAPIIPIGDNTYSFLELQLARIAGENNEHAIKAVNILAAENTAKTIASRLEELQRENSHLIDAINITSVLKRQGVPRIVPLAEDLESEKKFLDYCEKNGANSKELAQDIGKSAGDIVKVDGAISAKPPGHLSVILHYIHHRLKDELKEGVEVAFFHIGEDAYARPDPRFLSFALKNKAIATIALIESSNLEKGYLIDSAGKLQLAETVKNLGVKGPFYLNTSRLALNTEALATFLAGSVPNFMDLTEPQLRDTVTAKMINKLSPFLDIKPVENYTQWAGQFAFVVGQVSEVFTTKFVLCDNAYQKVLTFKTQQELKEILPIIQREYVPYLHYLR